MDKAVNEYDEVDFEPDYGTLTEELCRECKNGYYIKQAVSDYGTGYVFTWTCNFCNAVESN